MDPLRGSLVSKYLIRIWPAGSEPPSFERSEMCSPESVFDRQDGNDRAEIRAVRQWAQTYANAENVSYAFEVCRYSASAALAGGPARDTPIASGTLDPGGPADG